MSEKELKKAILEIASQYQGEIEINKNLAYVSAGDFYCQGEEALSLITEIENLSNKYEVTMEQAAVFVIDNIA